MVLLKEILKHVCSIHLSKWGFRVFEFPKDWIAIKEAVQTVSQRAGLAGARPVTHY